MRIKNKVLIVESQFYEKIANELRFGAKRELETATVDSEIISVPGVFEIPAAINLAINHSSKDVSIQSYKGAIALGCVIRGETDHYEHICREATRALMDLTLKYNLPFGFGLLTVENYDQALTRANPNGDKNAGGKAAQACLRMIELKKIFKRQVNNE